MDYTGVECPVCKNRFTEKDDIVVCPECGTPHHRECWFSLSHCANEDKHADGFEFESPRLREIKNKILNNEPLEDSLPEMAQKQPEGDFSSESEDPVFQAPILGGIGQMGLDIGPDPTVAGIPFEEARAFVGEDASSARLLFKITMIDKLKSLRFNFVTLLFPYLWFFYRKMYKLGAIVMALMLLVTVLFTNSNTLKYQQKLFNLYMQAMHGEITVEDYNAALLELQEKGTGNSYYYELAPQIINLVIRLFFALTANRFYLEHMKKQVLKTREECSSMDEYMAALRRKGGKSVGSAVLSVIAFAVLNTAVMALLFSVYL